MGSGLRLASGAAEPWQRGGHQPSALWVLTEGTAVDEPSHRALLVSQPLTALRPGSDFGERVLRKTQPGNSPQSNIVEFQQVQGGGEGMKKGIPSRETACTGKPRSF